MNKQNFMLTLNKWKEEKNLARLVYRILKFEDFEEENALSYVQICNKVSKFITTKQQREQWELDCKKEIEEFKEERFIEKIDDDCYGVYWTHHILYYQKDEKRIYSTDYSKELNEIKQKYQDKLCNREEVRKALKKVTETGWIEPIKIQSQNRNGEYIPGAYMTKYRATR